MAKKKIPPGLAKKPGQMPPGQFKKKYAPQQPGDIGGGPIQYYQKIQRQMGLGNKAKARALTADYRSRVAERESANPPAPVPGAPVGETTPLGGGQDLGPIERLQKRLAQKKTRPKGFSGGGLGPG